MKPTRRSAFSASFLGSSALLLGLALANARCASDDDLDLMGPSTGTAGTSAGSGGTPGAAGSAGAPVGGSAGGGTTGGQAGNAGKGGQSGTAGKAGSGGAAAAGAAGEAMGGAAGDGVGGSEDGGAAGEDGGDAGAAGEGGSSGNGGGGAGGSGPTGCCLTNADCPTLPFQQICAEGVCLAPPLALPQPNSCWADSECSTQRPKCVAESVCGCGEAGCSSAKNARGTCVQGSCCANDDDCEGTQRCLRPDGQGGFGRCSPDGGDGGCYANGECKGQQKCTGQKTCACGDAGCTPKPGKCGN